MLSSIRDWYIKRLIKKMEHPSDWVASKFTLRLSRMHGQAVSHVEPLIKHADPRVRYRAVWILGKSRDPDVFETILSCVEDPDHRVVYDALMALGDLGDRRAISYLRALADHFDDDPNGLDGAARIALTKLGVHH